MDDGLDLLPIARGDVRDGPAGLFPHALLARAQQVKQARQHGTIQDDLKIESVQTFNANDEIRVDLLISIFLLSSHLRLNVIARDDVPHRPERG